MKITNKIIGNTYDCTTGEYKDYIRVGGVEFFPEDLLRAINNGKMYLIRRNSITELSYYFHNGVYTFKSKLLLKGKTYQFTRVGRFYLVGKKEVDELIKFTLQKMEVKG